MTAPTRIHLGNQRVNGVMFLPRRWAQPAPYRVHDTKRDDIVHVSTDDLSRTAHIRRALLQQISAAKKKVLFCSFLFADEAIVAALCEAAERLHGGVYVLTALGKHLRTEVLEPDADVDAGTAKLQERAKRHEEHLRRLAYSGVWLRSAEDCHAKLCVVDDACATVTSANATQEAYELNPEDGLILRGPSIAREFGRLFAHVWQHLATLESTPGSRLDVHSLVPSQVPAWRALSGEGNIRLVTTLRRDETSVRDAVIEVIDRANERLAIATYSFVGMENHAVGAALTRAVARNVEIDLLVQPRNHLPAQRASLAWLVGLAPDRVRLHGHKRTHTKSIVADGQVALLWTGNLEARNGWETGIEVGAVVDDAAVATAVSGWTRDVMDRSTHVAIVAPSARELVDAGQPSALNGEWTLALPPGTETQPILTALSQNAVELLEVQGLLSLQCGNGTLIEVRVNESSRRVDISRVRLGLGSPVGGQGKGWLSASTLRVIPSESMASRQLGSTRARQQQRWPAKKGGKR